MNTVTIGGVQYRTQLTQERVDELIKLEELTSAEQRDVQYINDKICIWEDCEL